MTDIRNLASTITLAAAALCAPAGSAAAQDLANPRSELIDDARPQVWAAKTQRTERGHRTGNPEAEAELIEFISYTCSHCADFAKQSDGTLDLAAVGPGDLSVEVRPVIRNYLDLVVTMLVHCGEPEGFKNRHRMYLYAQDDWLKKAISAPQTQQAIWARGTAEARLSAARSLDLDDMLIGRGVTAPQVNACLADDAAAQAILDNERADRTEFGVTGTPTFALDGKRLEGVHNWPALSGVLQARFRPTRPQVSVNGRLTED